MLFLTSYSFPLFHNINTSTIIRNNAVIEDRLLFVRERANGYYRVGPFALSHTLVQLPFIAIIALSYTLICYWMINFNDSHAGLNFFYFLFTLFSALYVSESLVMMIAGMGDGYRYRYR